MPLITVAGAIQLLQSVPKVVAQLDEFKSLWDRLVASFDKEATQADLQGAYEAAISDATNAHTTLQDVVRRHSG